MSMIKPRHRWLFALAILLSASFAAAGCTTPIETTETTTTVNSVATEKPIPALRDVFADDFLIGAAIPARVLSSLDKKDLLESHFNSITCENEMKPQSLLGNFPRIGDDGMPVLDFAVADLFCDYAVKNGFRMRGHTLVWHSQTPTWFFREEYSLSGEEVDADGMRDRMEWYIHTVLDHFQTNYPGLIYAWDVVNEAATDGGGTWRTESPWYRIMGPGFVADAFAYAREYADADVSLYYNDYNLSTPRKADAVLRIVEEAAAAGNLDGIGMQSHIQLPDMFPTSTFPSGFPGKTETSIRKFTSIRNGKTGTPLRIQITELDIFLPKGGNTEENFEWQAKAYGHMLDLYRNLQTGGVALDSVTVWGLTDDMSWRADQYPLLFDRGNQPKSAFYAIVE